MPRVIHMWSPPRACSTALMYSFNNRADTTVVRHPFSITPAVISQFSGTDEPLYAHFLKKRPHLHRDEREAVMKTQSADWNEVVDKVLMGPYDTDVVMHKHMAKHVFWEEDLTFMEDPESIHVLLIRDPVQQLASWHRTKYERSMDETGLVHQFQLISYLESRGKEVVVVDATTLLKDPRGTLTELCRRCGIPFDEAMLEWPAGPKPEIDGAWAYYYYASVHKSTHFSAEVTPVVPFPNEMKQLLAFSEPLYSFMRRAAIGVAPRCPPSPPTTDAPPPRRTSVADAYSSSVDLVWVFDRPLTRHNAAISAVDPAVATGDVVRGCVSVRAGRCPLLDTHLERISALAKAKGYGTVNTVEQMRHAVHRTLAINDVSDGKVVSIVHTRSGAIVSVEPVFEGDPAVRGKCISAPAPVVDVGCDDGSDVASCADGVRLVLGPGGDVVNAHELGLCCVVGSTLVAPPCEVVATAVALNVALEGIDAFVKHVPDIRSVERRGVSLELLSSADEVFFVDAVSGVTSVHALDDGAIGCRSDSAPGPVTAKMQAAVEGVAGDEGLWELIPSCASRK